MALDQEGRKIMASDASIKAAVRARDGYKCRDCGMTNEEHIAKYKRKLNVHRLLPGSTYRVGLCVTLCQDCHKKKPKSLSDAVFYDYSDIRLFLVNLYDPGEKYIFDGITEIASRSGKEFSDVVNEALRLYIAANITSK